MIFIYSKLDILTVTNKSVHGRETRHGQYNFVCPTFRHITEAGRSVSVSSIRLWNSLPDDIKRKNSLSSFKNALIAYFRDSYIDIDNFEALL